MRMLVSHLAVTTFSSTEILFNGKDVETIITCTTSFFPNKIKDKELEYWSIINSTFRDSLKKKTILLFDKKQRLYLFLRDDIY